MKQTPCSARPYIQIYAELMKGPKTPAEMADLLNMAAYDARRFLKLMRSVRLVTITNQTQRVCIPRIYALGQDESRKAKKVPSSLIGFVAFLNSVEAPKSAKELSEEIGLSLRSIHKLVNCAKKYRLIRVGEWTRGNGSVWAANYVIGGGADKQKPKPVPIDELQAKRNEIKKRKREMQKMIQATAGFRLAA